MPPSAPPIPSAPGSADPRSQHPPRLVRPRPRRRPLPLRRPRHPRRRSHLRSPLPGLRLRLDPRLSRAHPRRDAPRSPEARSPPPPLRDLGRLRCPRPAAAIRRDPQHGLQSNRQLDPSSSRRRHRPPGPGAVGPPSRSTSSAPTDPPDRRPRALPGMTPPGPAQSALGSRRMADRPRRSPSPNRISGRPPLTMPPHRNRPPPLPWPRPSVPRRRRGTSSPQQPRRPPPGLAPPPLLLPTATPRTRAARRVPRPARCRGSPSGPCSPRCCPVQGW